MNINLTKIRQHSSSSILCLYHNNFIMKAAEGMQQDLWAGLLSCKSLLERGIRWGLIGRNLGGAIRGKSLLASRLQ